MKRKAAAADQEKKEQAEAALKIQVHAVLVFGHALCYCYGMQHNFSCHWPTTAAHPSQAIHRGKAQRAQMKADNESIARIQAIQRGKIARRHGAPVSVAEQVADEQALADSVGDALDHADAAVEEAALAELMMDPETANAASLIQARARGKASRKQQKEMEEAASRIQVSTLSVAL